MPAYTNPRPAGPEPGGDSGSGVRASMSAGSYREEHPDGSVYMEAINEQGVVEIFKEVFGPDTEVTIGD